MVCGRRRYRRSRDRAASDCRQWRQSDTFSRRRSRTAPATSRSRPSRRSRARGGVPESPSVGFHQTCLRHLHSVVRTCLRGRNASHLGRRLFGRSHGMSQRHSGLRSSARCLGTPAAASGRSARTGGIPRHTAVHLGHTSSSSSHSLPMGARASFSIGGWSHLSALRWGRGVMRQRTSVKGPDVVTVPNALTTCGRLDFHPGCLNAALCKFCQLGKPLLHVWHVVVCFEVFFRCKYLVKDKVTRILTVFLEKIDEIL